jgi:hypothetical protein
LLGAISQLACAGCGILALWTAPAAPLAGAVCTGLAVLWWAAAAYCWQHAFPAPQNTRSTKSGSSARSCSAKVRTKFAMMTAC